MRSLAASLNEMQPSASRADYAAENQRGGTQFGGKALEWMEISIS
jgi:hypothetical protein